MIQSFYINIVTNHIQKYDDKLKIDHLCWGRNGFDGIVWNLLVTVMELVLWGTLILQCAEVPHFNTDASSLQWTNFIPG